jgi:hypothetical protein
MRFWAGPWKIPCVGGLSRQFESAKYLPSTADFNFFANFWTSVTFILDTALDGAMAGLGSFGASYDSEVMSMKSV